MNRILLKNVLCGTELVIGQMYTSLASLSATTYIFQLSLFILGC